MELWRRDAGRIALGMLIGMLATAGYFCSEIRKADDASDEKKAAGEVRAEREAGARPMAR